MRLRLSSPGIAPSGRCDESEPCRRHRETLSGARFGRVATFNNFERRCGFLPCPHRRSQPAGQMPAPRRDEFRLRSEYDGLPAGGRVEHGRNARDGARAHHARRGRNLPARRVLVSGDSRRLHLDGTMVPTVVRSHRQGAGKISHIQRLEPASPGWPAAMSLTIDRDRLLSEIDELASFSDAEAPAVTRIVFSPTDLKARAWVKERCENAGLTVRQDAVGNTFARWNGSDPAAPVVGTGSHIDAIPNAGKFDGVVGVIGGLEAIRGLQQSGFRPRHSIELVIFTSEEPTRFGIGCLGSRLLSGSLSPEAARKLTDNDGGTLDEVRRAAGFGSDLDRVKLPGGSSRHCDENRCPGECSYLDRGLWRARRGCFDARPSRCSLRRRRADSGD